MASVEFPQMNKSIEKSDESRESKPMSTNNLVLNSDTQFYSDLNTLEFQQEANNTSEDVPSVTDQYSQMASLRH